MYREPFFRSILGCENAGGYRKNCVKMIQENMQFPKLVTLDDNKNMLSLLQEKLLEESTL